MKFTTLFTACALLHFRVIAQDAFECAPSSGSFIISIPQDLSNVNQCKTFTGNLTISKEWNGPSSISFEGLEIVSGYLEVSPGSTLTSLSSTTLSSVHELRFTMLDNLSSIRLPALNDFTILNVYHTTSLTELVMPISTGDGKIQDIFISNTSLTSLEWLTKPPTRYLVVSWNPSLDTFALPSSIIEVGAIYNFEDNAKMINLDVSILTDINGALYISNLPAPTLEFSQLGHVGGYVLINKGDYRNITMNGLDTVTGAIDVESYQDIQPLCDHFINLQIVSHTKCTAKVPREGTGGARLSKGAIAGIVIGGLCGAGILFGVAFLWYRRRRAIQQGSKLRDEQETDHSHILRKTPSLQELYSPVERLEMPCGKEMQELHPQDIKEKDGAGMAELDATGANAKRGSLNIRDEKIKDEASTVEGTGEEEAR